MIDYFDEVKNDLFKNSNDQNFFNLQFVIFG